MRIGERGQVVIPKDMRRVVERLELEVEGFRDQACDAAIAFLNSRSVIRRVDDQPQDAQEAQEGCLTNIPLVPLVHLVVNASSLMKPAACEPSPLYFGP